MSSNSNPENPSFLTNLKRGVSNSGLYTAYRKRGEKTTLNVLDAFPLFMPNSAGHYPSKSELTIQAVNQTFPFLASLVTSLGKGGTSMPSQEFVRNDDDKQAAMALKDLFDRYGSDKSTVHDYHLVYGPILKDRDAVTAVLEIGLGTNNTDVVSTMGVNGRPGASLRAFRDFLGNAAVYGADIDKGILFDEERISTHFVDQTSPDALQALGDKLPGDFDLIIDDGLHSPNANIATLEFALPRVRPGGWVVIEDIADAAIPVWEVVGAILPDDYESCIVNARRGNMFAVKRIR